MITDNLPYINVSLIVGLLLWNSLNASRQGREIRELNKRIDTMYDTVIGILTEKMRK